MHQPSITETCGGSIWASMQPEASEVYLPFRLYYGRQVHGHSQLEEGIDLGRLIEEFVQIDLRLALSRSCSSGRFLSEGGHQTSSLFDPSLLEVEQLAYRRSLSLEIRLRSSRSRLHLLIGGRFCKF